MSALSSRSSRVAITGRRPMNSGMRPNFRRSSGSTPFRMSPVRRSSGPVTLAPKPIEEPRPRREMIFSRPANAPPQIKRMLDVSTCRNSCWGCLRPPCGGTEAIGAFHDFEQRLLHALARDITGDGRVVGFARDLVDFVDVNDAALRPLDVVIGVLQQFQDDVLDILADVAGLGQRGCIRHRERHIQDARQRLGKQRLAAARRTQPAGCWILPARRRCFWRRG